MLRLSRTGKIGRFSLLAQTLLRKHVVRLLMGSLCLSLAGPHLATARAQDEIIDSGPVDVVVIENFVSDDSSIPSEGTDSSGGAGIEVTTLEIIVTDVVIDPTTGEPIDSPPTDDGGVGPRPYYRNLTSSGTGDPDEDLPIDDPLLWCFIDGPPFIYYMSGGNFPMSSLASSAQTPNQLAVATQLDALNGSTTPELQQLIDDIDLLPPDEQRTAFDSLSGEAFGTLSTIGMQIGQQSLRTVSNRLINNLSFLSGGSGMLMGQNSLSRPALGGNQVMRGQSPVFGATGWMQGFGNNSSFSNNGNAAGADYRLGGFAYGADLAGDETGVFGISGGHSSTQLSTDRGDTGNVTSHQVGLYLLKKFGSFYGLGIFNYGHNNNKLVRRVNIGGDQQLLSSGFNSNQFGTYGEGGVNLDTEAVRFQPFFGLQYLSLSNGSAFEGPGGGVGLNVNGNTTETFQTHLGGRAILQTMRSSSGIEFRPYLSGRWVADLLGTDSSATASFGGAPAGASWVVTGNHAGRHTGQIGPGFTAQVADGVSLFANYDYLFGAHFSSHTGSGGVLFEF